MRLLLAATAALAFAAGPPPTRKDNFKEVIHGVEIADPYRWLEDQESPEVRDWINRQNAYTRSVVPQREPLKRRLDELLRPESMSAPVYRAGSYYFSRRRPQDNLPGTWRRKGLDGEDELLLAPEKFSGDGSLTADWMDVSRNGKVLAYSVRRGGEDETEIRFLDPESKKDLASAIPRHLNRGFALKADGSGCYYTVQDREKGPRIRYRQFAPEKDAEIFGEGYGPQTFLSPMLAGEDRYLVVTAGHGWSRSDLLLLDLSKDGVRKPMITGQDALFRPIRAGRNLLVLTNWKAPNWRLLSADLDKPEPAHWTEIVPEAGESIQGVTASGGKLFITTLKEVGSRIGIHALDGRRTGEVTLPGFGTAGLSGDWEQREAFLTYTSYQHPQSIYRYDTVTGDRTLFFQPALPFQGERFEVRQVWYRSKDGTRVPMSLVHQKGLKPDGKRPVLLYGYGGFNVSLRPAFSPMAAVWIEHGGVYAVANIRGGAEFGEQWHRAGMLEKKQNVFDDFIAAAEWLIENKYTNPSRLAIQGGSNGGLLVGAVMTQRPELYRAVLCQYPDLDMIGYHRFKNNNKPALLEYGDASRPDHFEFLRKYSPYQRVRDGVKYPAVLLTTGDADTRVPPLQARKMTARLQAASTSGRPVLLLYDTQAGHAGGRTRAKLVEDMSLELAFLFKELGL
jgi:prolyl oligopeptidase